MITWEEKSLRGGRGTDVLQIFLEVQILRACGCLLDLREMVPRGRGFHLPVAEEVQGQDDHELAGAGRGSNRQGDQRD